MDSFSLVLEITQWILFLLILYRLFRMESNLVTLATGDELVLLLPEFTGWSVSKERPISHKELLDTNGALVFVAPVAHSVISPKAMIDTCISLGVEVIWVVLVASREQAQSLYSEVIRAMDDSLPASFDVVADPTAAIAVEFVISKFPSIVLFDEGGRITRTAAVSTAGP